MDVYIRSTGGTYLCADAASVTGGTSQAAYDSLLLLEAYDPVRKGPPADPTLKSQGLATLRNASGTLIAPQRGGAGRSVVELTKSGPNATAQLGYDVFRIFKVGAEKDEPIRYGDRIVLRFTPPGDNPPPMWMSVDHGELVFTEVNDPGEAQMFDLLLPVDMVDFAAEYDDITNGIIGQILLSGPMLPGGHTVHIESLDASELIAPQQLILDGSNTFVLPVKLETPPPTPPKPSKNNPAPSYITPCTPRSVTLQATYPASGATLQETVKLEGDRALFLSMKIVRAKKQKSPIPFFKPKNPPIDITVAVTLDPSAKRLNQNNFPLPVQLSTDAPQLKKFEQKGERVDYEKAIKLTFTIQPLKEGAPRECILVRAKYRLDGKNRESLFAVKLSPKGILLDPQG